MRDIGKGGQRDGLGVHKLRDGVDISVSKRKE